MSKPSPVDKDHPVILSGKIGILLINLGTPDTTSYWPMRRYLKEFLSDPRVVEANRLVWWFVLNGIILSKRPQKSGLAYDKIWNQERNESPLRTITRSQCEGVSEKFCDNDRIVVDWAMRYGTPSIKDKIGKLKDKGCERIVLFPLYPQYSAATTASALDKAYEALQLMRWQPSIRTVPPYFDDPVYIEALGESISSHLAELDWKPDLILASFHGLPEAFHAKGDPYYSHCQDTVQLLRQHLAVTEDQLQLTFQSRPGRKEWLKPYTDQVLIGAAQNGIENMLVITPGFSADCLETLEEIAIRGKDSFVEHGGKNFSAQPCLNNQPCSIDMLTAIITQQLQGWL